MKRYMLFAITFSIGLMAVVLAVGTDQSRAKTDRALLPSVLDPVRPPARFGAVAAVIAGKLYIVGGANRAIQALKTLQVYDPATDTWTELKPMSTARFFPAAGVIDGKLYVVGGRNESVGVLDTLEVYDPATNNWTPKKNMPVQRMEMAAGVIDGKLYVVGGQTRAVALSELAVYDPVTDIWSSSSLPASHLPTMPTARWDLTAAVINRRLYAIGGRDGNTYYSKVEVYDPGTNEWNKASLRGMSIERAYLASQVLNNKIYAIGGSTKSLCVVPNVEVYDALNDHWTNAVDMPTARDSLVVGLVDNKLYASSGFTYGTDSGAIEPLNMLEVYDPTTGWTTSSGGPVGVKCRSEQIVRVPPVSRDSIDCGLFGPNHAEIECDATTSHAHCWPDFSLLGYCKAKCTCEAGPPPPPSPTKPPQDIQVVAISIDPSIVSSGQSAEIIVTINRPAPPGGISVGLILSSTGSALDFKYRPYNVAIAAGDTQGHAFAEIERNPLNRDPEVRATFQAYIGARKGPAATLTIH